MTKLPLGAAAIALTLALGAPSLSADEWHGGHGGTSYRHHYQTRHSAYYPQPRHSWQEHHAHSYYPRAHGYDGGYDRHAVYNAGFNHGAEAQWRIAYRRWAYEYAAWRQWRGPTGIFALAGGLTGGGGYGGGEYGTPGGYGQQCNCEN
jgi:hypothetical protein